jgi:hypothetical protein
VKFLAFQRILKTNKRINCQAYPGYPCPLQRLIHMDYGYWIWHVTLGILLVSILKGSFFCFVLFLFLFLFLFWVFDRRI